MSLAYESLAKTNVGELRLRLCPQPAHCVPADTILRGQQPPFPPALSIHLFARYRNDDTR